MKTSTLPCKECGSYLAGGLGYCNRHYIQFRKYGRVLTAEEIKSHYKKTPGKRLNTGRTHFKKGHRPHQAGKSDWMTPEHKEALRQSNIGRTPWNKGQPHLAKEKNPAWKGGVQTESRKDRVKFGRLYQQLVFQRDEYTCQACFQYAGNLQVDHIKSWAKFPELRFDLDNCRTLCMACHYYVTFKRKMPKGIIWGHNLSRRIV